MMRWLIIWALSATLFGVSAAPSGDATWVACTKAPTRACVFDEAFKTARASTQLENAVGHVLTAFAEVDPGGALRLVPAAEADRKTLRAADARAHVDAALVDVYAKARNFPEAERVLARVKGTSAYDRSLRAMHGRYLTMPAYDAAALALAGEMARAQSVAAAVARLRALGVAPKTNFFSSTATGGFFNGVAALAVARGEEAALLAYAREVSAAAAKRGDYVATIHSPVLAVAFAMLEAGKVEPALAAVSRIPAYTGRMSGWGWFGAELIDAGRVDEALAASSKIGNAAERNEALREMVTPQSYVRFVLKRPLAKLERPVRAEEAKRLAATFSGEARDNAYALIARSCAASGAVAEAWSAARKIRTAFATHYALKAIGTAEAKAGKAQASLATFAQARANARTDTTGAMLEDILRLQTSLGQFDAVKAIMREEASNPRSKIDHKAAQYDLMLSYAKAGRVDEAFQTPYDDMPRELRRDDIAKELAIGGFGKKAVALVLAGPEPRDEKDRTLFAIVFERVLRGALDDAALALAAISPSGRQFALLELAEAHAKAGNRAKALPLIREALQVPLPPLEPYDQLNSGFTFLLRAGSALPG